MPHRKLSGPPLAVEALPPEEQPVAQMAATILGEHRIKWVDRRMLVLYLLVVAMFIGGGWYLKHTGDAQDRKQAMQAQQLAAAQARTDDNCRETNLAFGKVNAYYDRQIKNLTARTDLTPKARQASIANAEQSKLKMLDCGTTAAAPAQVSPTPPFVPHKADRKFSFRPFEGVHDVTDFVRILICVTGVSLLGLIGRVMREGVRRHNMDRWQVARFIGLGLIVLSLSLGSAERFGGALNWHVPVNLAAIAISWFGVLGIRREQRRGGQ